LKGFPKVSNRRIAAIASFAPKHGFKEDTLYFLRAVTGNLRELGYEVVIGVALQNVLRKPKLNIEGAYVFFRRNIGYDFGTWSAIVGKKGVIANDDWIFLNDSLIGPLFDSLPFLERFIAKKEDYVGVTESFQIKPHYQSYMWRTKGSVLLNVEVCKLLWAKLTVNSRDYAINQKEIQVLETVKSAGFSTSIIFPAGQFIESEKNQTLYAWEELINAGFPFVKASLKKTLGFQERFQTLLRNL